MNTLDVREALDPGIRVHSAPETLAPFEESWRDLVAATPGGSYFTTPDWVLAYWETAEPDAADEAEVALWNTSDGVVEAVVPLARTTVRLHPRIRLPVSCWTPLAFGADAADHGSFPAVPTRRDDVRGWLRERTRGHSLWLPALDADADTTLLPAGTRRVAATPCPRLVLDPDTPIGSPGFRRLMRRRERQLAAEGVTFRWVPPAEMTAGDLDSVLRLHRVRQEHKGLATDFGPERAAFHTRLLHRAAADRGPAVMLAERDGRAVAAIYGFVWQDTFAYYNGGWEPAYARLGLGTLTMDLAIGEARRAGLRTFDFLRGAESYKYRPFGAHDRHDGQWLRPAGVNARLAAPALRYGKARAARRVHDRAAVK